MSKACAGHHDEMLIELQADLSNSILLIIGNTCLGLLKSQKSRLFPLHVILALVDVPRITEIACMQSFANVHLTQVQLGAEY